ncbi:MAG: zinc ribbon domain-containing protein, partial [Lachnospiraceae bacterium]|nr:zinc ribbon domain-containing protein [Lachnospiraceae bacterium]
MFCPNCGAQSDGGKFCGSCGFPLPIVPESAVKENSPAPAPVSDPLPWEAPIDNPAPIPEAGETLAGSPFTDPQYQPYVPAENEAAGPQKEKKKAKPWLLAAIIGGGVLLLAALALLVIFVFIKKDPTAQVGAAAAKSMAALSKTETGKIASELEKAEVKVSMDLSSVIPYARGLDGSVELTFSEDLDAGKINLLLSLLMKGKEVAD